MDTTTQYFKGPNEGRPFAHMFFFQLCDTDPKLVTKFIDLCREYLSGHPGQDHFSVGIRALEINRDVSGTNFEVSVHMIFANIQAFNEYSASETHEVFITKSAGMSPIRIVYDSYLALSVLPKPTAPSGGKPKPAANAKAKAKPTAKPKPRKKTR